ncbi:nucleotide pyrophosphatase/phosphodiesterase-like protein, partial [Tanacetum coccineum]
GSKEKMGQFVKVLSLKSNAWEGIGKLKYKFLTSSKSGKLCSDLLEHMDKSWMNIVHRLSDPRYELGVMKFLDFAYRDKDRWTEHGETSTSHSEDYVDDGEDDTLIDESDDMSDDDLDDIYLVKEEASGRQLLSPMNSLELCNATTVSGHYQPQVGKPAFWELDSDQHQNFVELLLEDWNKLIDLISLMMNRATGKELLKEDGTQDESAIDRAEPQLQRPGTGRSIHVNPLYFEARQKLQQSNRVKTVVLNKPCNKGEYKTLHRRTYNSETNISATRLQSLRKQRMTRSKRTILDSILSEDVCIMPCKGINIFPMTVTWTSGYNIDEATTIIEWGRKGQNKKLSPAGALTFTRSSMCGHLHELLDGVILVFPTRVSKGIVA